MSINIPKSGLDALAALLQATPEFLAALQNALEATKPRVQWSDLEWELVSILKSFPEAKPETIRGVLRMFNGVIYATDDESPPDVVADLLHSAQASGDSRLDSSEESWSRVREFLEKVLALKQLQISSKALSLFSDTARHMHGARLLTDARPMYSSDPDEGPIGFLIMHTLRLNYYENDKVMEWYLALDSDDLETLRDVVDRAIKKEKSLKDCLKKTEIDVISYRDDLDEHS